MKPAHLRALAVRTAGVFLGLAICATSAYGTHFRYGQLSWVPRPDIGPRTVEFKFDAAFRRNGYSGTHPDDGRPQTGDSFVETIGATGLCFGDGGCTGTLTFIVTSFDPDLNLVEARASYLGTGTILRDYPADGNYVASVSSCCRVSTCSPPNAHLNNGDGSYRLETTVQVGSANSAPASNLPAIVTCQRDALCTFTVPASDNEDPVSFRLATSSESSLSQPSCGSGVSIHPTTGVYTWDTTGCPVAADIGCTSASVSLYSTQVILSDGSTSTPLDFFIRLVDTAPPPPPETNPPVCGTTVATNPEGVVTVDVTAADPNSLQPVTLNVSGLPAGAVMSPQLPVSGNPVASTFTWEPTAAQVGQHVITFRARAADGSESLCPVTIDVSFEICDDGVDNDGDDLIDCDDPDCPSCGHGPVCPPCQSTPTPTAIAAATPTPTVAAICGNGLLEPGEQCDPGTAVAGDCCDDNCQFETSGSACDADDESCTIDACDGGGVCIGGSAAADGSACDDRNACTEGDVCTDGVCDGSPVDCDDGFACTDDRCHPVAGCLNIATVESRDCPGSCFDGINNDPDDNPWTDFEDPSCSTLGSLARLTIVASEAKRRTDLIAAVDATVARQRVEATCDTATASCRCPSIDCTSGGQACSHDGDCVDGSCGAGGRCVCPQLGCANAGLTCADDADCAFAVAGTCDSDLGLCTCPAESPACHALYRPCSGPEDCAVAPFPSGPSTGGVCGNGLHIAAGTQVGFFATRTTARFGSPRERAQRDAEMAIEFANSGGSVIVPTNSGAPLVGPTVCSNALNQPCEADDDCPGGSCNARNRLRTGSIFESDDGQPGAGLAGSGSSLNFKLCDQAMSLLEPIGRDSAPLQQEIEALAATMVLGPTNCRICRSVNAADAACEPCPSGFESMRTGSGAKKIVVTFDGGLQVLDLKRMVLTSRTVLELRGQSDTVAVVRVERAMRIGVDTRVALGGNGTNQGVLEPTQLLWVAEGSAGGRIQLANGSVFRGTLLASARRGIRVGKQVMAQGALYSQKVSLGAESQVQHFPFTALLP